MPLAQGAGEEQVWAWDRHTWPMARTSRSASPTAAGSSRRVAGPAALIERAGLWPLRLVWLLAPIGIGVGLGDWLDHFTGVGGTLAELALWAGWFAGLVACLVPTTISLTVIRSAAPALVVLVAVAGLVGGGGAAATAGAVAGGWDGARLEALLYAIGLTVVAFLPVTGDRMINGSAYGSERRMALRPPAFALLGPVELAWLLVLAGLLTGPLLVANGHYVSGGIASVIGVAACWAGGRVLHQLARRWIVFVPAGFVIHDHVGLVESIMLRRHNVAALGPATLPVADKTADVSGGAYGLALEVVAREPVLFGRRRRNEIFDTEADRVVFTPTLPGAVLREARIRAIRIGAPSDATADNASSPVTASDIAAADNVAPSPASSPEL